MKESINEDSIILNGDTETINNSNIDKLGVNFDIPTDWKSLQQPSSSFKEKEPVLPYETVPHTPDLYLIWIKAKDNNSKELYGYFLVNRLPNGGLVAKVSYDPTTNTEKEVTATITANRQIKEVDGWKLSEDKTKLTKIYTNNAVETVTVMDNNNNSVQLTITVNNIIKKVETETDKDEDKDKDNNKNNIAGNVSVTGNNNNSVQQKAPVNNSIKKVTNNKVIKDNTVAKSALPKTGLQIDIIVMIILTLSLAIILYFKYSKYKDI